jgi:transposase
MERLVPAAATARSRHWCKKPDGKHGPEVTYRSGGDVRPGGDPVQEFARFVNLGPQVPAESGLTSKKSKSKGKGNGRMLPVLHADTAGIDIGAEEIFVAVSAERTPESVRSFGSFTRDLHELADWLQECRVRTVAMESTGVYWIPLYQILETRGFQVFLVNAQHVKNVPGRKSDVSDCQWIQYLHSVGLLKASFRPPDEICVLRSLWRQSGESCSHGGGAHHAHAESAESDESTTAPCVSDITGLSGLAIRDAILSGERDPVKLAGLCNGRVKSPRDKVAKL